MKQIFSPLWTRTVCLAFAFSLSVSGVGCSTPLKPAETAVPKPSEHSLHKGAVLAGDYPDPSVIKVGDTFWATATSSAWAPAYPLFMSKDLANWKLAGSVFATKPEWSDGNYWAPEIAKMANRFYVFYTARKKGANLCIAVASASSPSGPYRDHGPLECQDVGSIDAAPVVNEKGEKFLLWKEDGNSQDKPTPIWIQPLSADGTKLTGDRKVTIRNDAPWEKNLVEGPFVMKHGDFWYMFYSGNACCGLQCDYALGVARAKDLQGPWEKNPKNPILKGNDVWKCPGHGSIVSDDGTDVLMYHAYHHRDSVYIGRQALADPITWHADGWPTINAGLGPSVHADRTFTARLKNEEHSFTDEFTASTLQPGWQWPHANKPNVRLSGGKLMLSPSVETKEGDPLGAVLARSATLGDYTATVRMVLKNTKSQDLVGLSAFGEPANALGLSAGNGKLTLWRRLKNEHAVIQQWDAPQATPLHLRMIAREGRYFRFESSVDGISWEKRGDELDGTALPPWDLGIRIALTAGGGKNSQGMFESLRVEPNP